MQNVMTSKDLKPVTVWNAANADAAVISVLQRDLLHRVSSPCVKWFLPAAGRNKGRKRNGRNV
jgi:plasmid replication initiation protein